jgi:hypothetical protein
VRVKHLTLVETFIAMNAASADAQLR